MSEGSKIAPGAHTPDKPKPMPKQDKMKLIKVEEYRRLNQFARPGQVVMAGSSLMEFFPINELLMDLGRPLVVYNRGIAGTTTSELLENLDACVLDLKPAHVFINIGTNDQNGPDYQIPELIGRYRSILERIIGALPQVRLHLMAYYPVNADAHPNSGMAKALVWRTNERIAEANRAVEQLAQEFDAEFLDVNAGLTDEAGRLRAELTADGVHMFADGYRVVLNNLLPHLEAVCERR